MRRGAFAQSLADHADVRLSPRTTKSYPRWRGPRAGRYASARTAVGSTSAPAGAEEVDREQRPPCDGAGRPRPDESRLSLRDAIAGTRTTRSVTSTTLPYATSPSSPSPPRFDHGHDHGLRKETPMQDPFAPTGVPAGFSHPNQHRPTSLVSSRTRDGQGRQRQGIPRGDPGVAQGGPRRGVGRLGPPSASEADDAAERLPKPAQGGPRRPSGTGFGAREGEAYFNALQDDLAAKKGTPGEAHVRAELKRAPAALAAVTEAS